MVTEKVLVNAVLANAELMETAAIETAAVFFLRNPVEDYFSNFETSSTCSGLARTQ